MKSHEVSRAFKIATAAMALFVGATACSSESGSEPTVLTAPESGCEIVFDSIFALDQMPVQPFIGNNLGAGTSLTAAHAEFLRCEEGAVSIEGNQTQPWVIKVDIEEIPLKRITDYGDTAICYIGGVVSEGQIPFVDKSGAQYFAGACQDL